MSKNFTNVTALGYNIQEIKVIKPKENINFVKSLVPSLIALALIWAVFFLDKYLSFSLTTFGILPRSFVGLRGILFSPFIHVDLNHIAGNSLPLAVLLFYLFTFYRDLFFRFLIWSTLMTGFWVWVSARGSYHIGASGVIYALWSFLFISGIIRKHRTLMIVSLSVAFLYGSFVWGVFPIEDKVSWESHAWGAISGAVLALYYRKVGYQRVPNSWEKVSEQEYLADNIRKYGEYYWDPVKQRQLQLEMEEKASQSLPHYQVFYHFVPQKPENEKGPL